VKLLAVFKIKELVEERKEEKTREMHFTCRTMRD
jgi:hypothetical protein